ncbi:hypothetical protein DEA8626_03486 [Defluviimonas aquaemixtae]|uniref:Phosphatidic acid phosphatase type 2/haloperoxidase domain-containing protein n=1 Tax=Albidovulum aquaemixtae TaxID=1542388 RepID=A0A2R8BLW9_9RHOB|nr:phosphatase PAP2 family protein [Defluviimonas aquaemixtae]SPH24434.1 hypothetical protein DEA8626_03486 [Defluviimonas aquaemixtae]
MRNRVQAVVRHVRPVVGRITAEAKLRARILIAILILSVVLAYPSTRRIGDTVQIVLPLAAFGCEMLNGRAAAFLGRFVLLEAGIHVPKSLLGDAKANLRPNGGEAGMPSGHTAAAVFGAAYLTDRCIANNPVARGSMILAAGFVGGSRIENGNHTLWQVLAGALLGWAAQRMSFRVFRRLVRAHCPRLRLAS